MRRGLLSLAVSLLVWVIYTWPLALHVREAIPSSSHNIEIGQQRQMIPGDHLQLLYHFWIFGDMLRGETPWFHNLYEFNIGDDARRFYPSPYFVPFSAVYALLSTFVGRALAWNLTGFLTIWLTLWLTWWVVRRFVDDEAASLCAALLSVTFTYRWVLLLGGSPSGFSMMCVPLALGGAHMALRDRSPGGGWVAGAGLLLNCLSDPHSFYFLALFFPVWCLLCTIDAPTWRWTELRTYLLATRVLLPVPLLVGVGLGLRAYFEHFLEGDVLRTGRTLKEVAGFSPNWRGLFQWERTGINNHIFLGIGLCVMLVAAALLVAAPGRWASVKGRRRLLLGAMLVCIGGMLALALGSNAPWDGLPLRVARDWIPRYSLIRQPARILVLMPTLLAIPAGCLLAALCRGALARCARPFLIGWSLWLVAEGRTQVEATLSGVDTRQGAYEAVVKDRRGIDGPPRALVVPLWPGDSDLSSTYLHYASLYRIRLWNGYSPVVSTNYLEHGFRPLESANQGWLSSEQLAYLRERGVHHLLVHEDQFPEKVSPFPVQVTLDGFLRNPALTLLHRDGPVWAFRIEAEGSGAEKADPGDLLYLPTRWYEPELIADRRGEVLAEPAASRAALLRMASEGDGVATPPVKAAPHPGLAWFLRVRGEGLLRLRLAGDAPDAVPRMQQVAGPDWTWLSVPVEATGFGSVQLSIERAGGAVELDAVYLGPPQGTTPARGEEVAWTANRFFHAGESDLHTGKVCFLAAREPHGEILYAKWPPLPVGSYEATLEYRVEGDIPPVLGAWRAEASADAQEVPVRGSDTTATVRFRQQDELPVRLAFRYDRAADVELMRIRLRRLAEAGDAQPGRNDS